MRQNLVCRNRLMSGARRDNGRDIRRLLEAITWLKGNSFGCLLVQHCQQRQHRGVLVRD